MAGEVRGVEREEQGLGARERRKGESDQVFNRQKPAIGG